MKRPASPPDYIVWAICACALFGALSFVDYPERAGQSPSNVWADCARLASGDARPLHGDQFVPAALLYGAVAGLCGWWLQVLTVGCVGRLVGGPPDPAEVENYGDPTDDTAAPRPLAPARPAGQNAGGRSMFGEGNLRG